MTEPRRFVLREEVSGSYYADAPDAAATLLVPLSGSRFPADRSTNGVDLEFVHDVDFETQAGTFRSSAAVLSCRQALLVPTFRVLASDVARRAEASTRRPSPPVVSRLLAEWEQLLRMPQRLTTEEEIGLWGELTTILQTECVDAAVAAWRGPDKAPVDFVGGRVGIETKASRVRLQHQFSMSQLDRPLGDLETYVLSMWVGEDTADGRTINELADEIRDRVADQAVFEARLLRYGYSRADAAFYRLALTLLEAPLWFHRNAIPRVRVFDDGITAIRYTTLLDPRLAEGEEEAGRILRTFVGDRPEMLAGT